MPGHENPRSPWFILWIVLLASVAASLNQFKVPPVLPLLMDAFQLRAAEAGLLMSIFAFTGLLLAIPAGFIFQKWGYRKTGLIASASIIGGATMGALTRNFETLLISRFIEGAGMSLMSVVAPAIIAIWFAPEVRGRAMGVWAVWVPLGSTVMFMIAPLLARQWGWQGAWWFGTLYALSVGVLYFLFIRGSEQGGIPRPAVSHQGLAGRDLAGVFRNRDLWLISFLFCCFNFTFIGFVTWVPTFLHEIRGRSLANASLAVSLITLVTMLSTPLAGWISDRIGSRKWICIIPMVLLMLLYPISFYVRGEGIIGFGIALGFIAGFVPTGVFSAGIEVVGDERLGGMAMAIIQIGQNAGMLLGPLVLGWMIESGGGSWAIAFWALAPVSALGAAAGGLARVR